LTINLGKVLSLPLVTCYYIGYHSIGHSGRYLGPAADDLKSWRSPNYPQRQDGIEQKDESHGDFFEDEPNQAERQDRLTPYPISSEPIRKRKEDPW
jgi:hypothetical protein